MITPPEFERRLPVWEALSDLFLDTELQPGDYRHIAEVLLSSEYGTAELKMIFQEEVAPAFGSNMFSLAGEWAGWDTEIVRELMTKQIYGRAKPQVVRWLMRKLLSGHITEEWRKLELLLSGGPSVY